jgi:hypothetical protein
MWHGTKNNPCVNFNPQKSWISDKKQNPPKFSSFMVACRLGEGVAYYTVDTYTGDVFDPILECFEIKNKTRNLAKANSSHSPFNAGRVQKNQNKRAGVL